MAAKFSTISIECQLFKFRGGAPPYRGFHYSDSITITMPPNQPVGELMMQVKEQVDPGNKRDLSYLLLEDETEKPLEDPTLPVGELFSSEKTKLKVMVPFAKGMYDVGTFGMLLSSPGADILLGKENEQTSTDACDEKNCEKCEKCEGCHACHNQEFTNQQFSSHELSHLLSHFEARADGGKLQEFPQVLNQKECQSIRGFINGRFERAGVNATEDFKVFLKPHQLSDLVGDHRGSELLELFGAPCHEVILRRSCAGGKFINFHTDQTLQTLNIPLNDAKEYKGGQLVYAKESGLVWPERKAGSATLHTNKIVHGVTPVLCGVRYAMFLLHHQA